MSEPEMVERVARAICRPNCDGAAHPCDREDGHTCKPASCRHWRVYTDTARAAIEAMREPTKKMIRRGADQCDGSEFAAEGTWETMIDAALAEPTAPR